MFLKTKKYKHFIQAIMRFAETLSGQFFMKAVLVENLPERQFKGHKMHEF